MNAKTNINISHINISSITQKPKQMILNEYLVKNNMHIMSINETHLKQINTFELKGYKIYRKDRIGKRKGGVAIAVAENLLSEPYQIDTNTQMEFIATKIKLQNTEIIVISYYVAPTQEIFLPEVIKILKNNKNVIILGDLNAKNQLWYCRETNKTGESVEQLIQSQNLIIHNNKTPTFIYSNNILDLMLSSESLSNHIFDFDTNNIIKSDHMMITAKIKIDGNPNQIITSKEIPNWKKYKSYLENNYQSVESNLTLNEKVKHLQDSIIRAHEISKVTIEKSNPIKILPKHITDLITEKKKIRSEFIKSRSVEKALDQNVMTLRSWLLLGLHWYNTEEAPIGLASVSIVVFQSLLKYPKHLVVSTFFKNCNCARLSSSHDILACLCVMFRNKFE